MKIVILAFNYARAGKFVNGPGICLANLVQILKKSGVEVSIFTQLKTPEVHSIENKRLCHSEIRNSDLIIHWSGISQIATDMIKFSNLLGKKVFLGSNLIDGVEEEREKTFLSQISFCKILTVNHHLKFLIAKKYNIEIDKIEILKVGPDLALWKPSKERDNSILWKGNSKHFVKDVNFGLELQRLMPEYKFKFIGYPHPYNYFDHIEEAKRSKMYISTSISETMGATLIESWSSGLPSVTHPKIQLHGLNYQTGIITNKNFSDYKEAICSIMKDNNLYKYLSQACQEYVLQNFSESKIWEDFKKIAEI